MTILHGLQPYFIPQLIIHALLSLHYQPNYAHLHNAVYFRFYLELQSRARAHLFYKNLNPDYHEVQNYRHSENHQGYQDYFQHPNHLPC